MYFRNSGMLLIPAVYFAAYLFAWRISSQGERNWLDGNWGWIETYVVLIVLTLLMQIPVFLIPVLSFHARMTEACQAWRDEIDEAVCPRLVGVESELIHCDDQARQNELKKEQALLVDQYGTMKRCPTWPVDTSIRRRFTVSNVILVIPLITTALAGDSSESLMDQFLNVLEKLTQGSG
jgi:hypothetical protein